MCVRIEPNADLWISRIRLQSIQKHLGEGVLESRAVAGNDDRTAAGFAFEVGGFYRLVPASLLESFFDKRRQRECLLGNDRIAGQESHLIDQAGDPFDSVGQR